MARIGRRKKIRHSTRIHHKACDELGQKEIIPTPQKTALGRRNLTPDQMSLIRGRRYNRMKKANGQRGPEKLGQNDPAFSSTAEILAKQYKWPTRGFYLTKGEIYSLCRENRAMAFHQRQPAMKSTEPSRYSA